MTAEIQSKIRDEREVTEKVGRCPTFLSNTTENSRSKVYIGLILRAFVPCTMRCTAETSLAPIATVFITPTVALVNLWAHLTTPKSTLFLKLSILF